MKKHVMLGVTGNQCCLLISLLSFSSLTPEEVEASDFIHDSTNWCGCDSIERTLKLKKLVATGNKITLPHHITFHGYDEDWGHTYPWEFRVNEIHEVVDPT